MRTVVAICLVFLVAPEVMAEVSDKAASQLQLWLQGIFVGGSALVAGLYRPLLGIMTGLLFTLFFGYGAYSTLVEPHIGPGLLTEQGEAYRIALFALPALCAVGAAIGAFLGLRTRDIFGERRASS